MQKALLAVLQCGVLWLGTTAAAQATLSGDEAAALRELSAQAGVVFAGQVLSITRTGVARNRVGRPDESGGLVIIQFRVETAIRGCGADSTYMLREWGGLWVGQSPRYRVGQHLLMLLAAPGPGGLSAPAGGQDGAIPLEPMASAPGGKAVLTPDLRWIAARSVRRPSQTAAAASRPSLEAVLALLYGANDAAR